MPRIRGAIRSGWKYSSWSSFSPTETSLIGLPVTALTESAAPPRASPSSFVSTTPSKATRSSKASATRTASWPVIESSTSRTFVGLRRVAHALRARPSAPRRRGGGRRCRGSPCRGPRRRRCSSPCCTALTGSARSSLKTGTWIWRPSCSSWSIAAGRCRSAATSPGLRPSLRSSSASLAAAVVLPEPCRPASRITVGGRPANASLRVARAHQRRQLLVDDLHDLLAWRQALGHVLAERPLAHAGDEVLDDLEVDVGLEQREPDLAHRARDRLLVQASLLAQVAEGALEPV